MDEMLVTGKTLKTRGWPEGKTIGLAKTAAAHLMQDGLSREAALAIETQPGSCPRRRGPPQLRAALIKVPLALRFGLCAFVAVTVTISR